MPTVSIMNDAQKLRWKMRLGVDAHALAVGEEPVAVEHVVDLLEQRGDPPDVRLDEQQLDVGEPLEHAGEEQLAHDRQRVRARLRRARPRP